MSRHLGSVSELRRSRAYRSIARVAIAGQLLTLLPATATTAAGQSPIASLATDAAARAADDIETLLADYLLGADQRGTTGPGDRQGDLQGDRPISPVPTVLEPKRVVVNRTVPRVTPPPSAPSFSADPTDLEFRRVRIFAEALVPVGRATRPDENRALATALMAYVASDNTEAVSGLLEVLLRYPDSPWRASLMANVGTVFSQTGYYSRALRSWDEAWRLTKEATDLNGRTVADYALGQWFDLMTRLGQSNLLAARLEEIKGRSVRGPAAAKVGLAREGLWVLTHRHHDAIASASVALAGLLASTNSGTPSTAKVLAAHHPGTNGTSLLEVQRLARTVGFAGRMAYRDPAVEPIAPSIVHLKIGHYAALVKAERGLFLMRDAILGDRWITRQALEDEESGYYLVPEDRLAEGWRNVDATEGAVVIGHCHPGAPDGQDPAGPCPPEDEDDDGNDDDCTTGDCEKGMATYDFHPVTAALRVKDAPVGYKPPRGPAVYFSVRYNHRNTQLPQIATFGHIGPQWDFDWLSYVSESPGGGCSVYGCTAPQVTVNLRGDGAEEYAGGLSTSNFGIHWRSRASFVRTSSDPIRYERRLPDGSVEVFGLSDGAPAGQRRVFLTELVDAHGQQVEFTYDSMLRLVAITDAIGQVTTIAYDSAEDQLRITKVTDPFGRFATFTYNSSGQLASITDVIGLTSSFSYGSGDFITALTTPYGTTTFRAETNGGFPRIIEATDPMGGTERLEFHHTAAALPDSVPANQVPTGFTAYNTELNKYVTLRWSKRAMALYPGDVSKATVTRYLLNRPVQAFLPFAHHTSSIPHSRKRPLEGRVWFAYQNQTSVAYAGDGRRPTKIASVLDDGTSQIVEATYNSLGHLASQTDALGRRTSFVYAANGIDLLDIRQTTGSLNELLATFANYTAGHQPQSLTDAAGQTTTIVYGGHGRIISMTNAKSETSNYTWDSYGSYLQSSSGPVTGTTTAYTYDGYGRLRTRTDPDGYTVTASFDNLDRPTRFDYPDGTYEQLVYDKLDLARVRDRLGRWSYGSYDPNRRMTAMRDPAGRVVQQTWCACGSLDAILDGKGQKTSMQYDAQGRLVGQIRADGTTEIEYAFEATTSRLKTITDPKQQVTTFTYNLDDSIQSVVYTNTTIATPSVSYTYDVNYPRVATRVDGTGVTTYAYRAMGALGAGERESVDGPLTNDTVVYGYDELGRITSRAINSVSSTFVYDALGRMTSEVNPLGTFVFDYDAATQRIESIQYPNGQTSAFEYFGNTGDHRLQTIHHTRADTSTLSRFDYTYDTVGNVSSWQQQRDSDPAQLWEYAYDGADQLLRAHKRTTGLTPTIMKRYSYVYDLAGNRTSEQVDDTVLESVYNVLNRITQRRPGGVMRVAGTVSEPATVTIQGIPASVSPTSAFAGNTPVGQGTTTISIVATDANGNTASKQYEVGALGVTSAYAYDANGNVTSDGTRTFEWDASDRLVGVTQGTQRTEYTYNGIGERVRIVQLTDGIPTSDRRYVWTNALAEERDSAGAVTKRYFSGGVQEGGVAYFYARDHLGNITELTDGSSTTRARYDYDPFGRQVRLAGDRHADAGFTGHYSDRQAALALTRFRSYDPDLGQWLSEDPLGSSSASVYAYVGNNPIRLIDPLGLQETPPPPPNIPGGPWDWESDKTNDRGGTWRDKSGRKASWDPEGHWDVDEPGADSQKGPRQRYDNRGNPLTTEQAHNPKGPRSKPIDFTKRPRGPRNVIRGLGRLCILGMILEAAALAEMYEYCKANPCECSSRPCFGPTEGE